MATRTIRDLAEVAPLLDLSLDEIGERVATPAFLVCTNGKRDACCALRGRALVAAMPAESTWECTHLGGHRFAGNLVCLPDGIVYGRVTASDGPRLAAAYRDGRIDPAFLRGRSAWPPPAQVAEMQLRSRLRLVGLRDVVLEACDVDGDRASVSLSVRGATYRLELVAERLSPPRPISCRADELEEPPHWRVV
jgi:hypothetical protein